jgi:uncharacterized membrane protein YqgA involved in biofilm formation
LFDAGMIGVAINAVGIVAGAIVGKTTKRTLNARDESFFKVATGAAAVFLGLQLTWQSFSGSFGLRFKQLLIVLLSMSLGKLAGRLFHLQNVSNAIGRFASSKISGAQTAEQNFSNGFLICALLACANPLSIFASVQEGLSATNLAPIFVVKAVIDGLAAMSFARIFGWNVVLAAIPVFAFEGTIILLAKGSFPFLQQHGLVDCIFTTDGLLIFCVALVALNLKKIALADYIPSLAIAPLITWIWK